MFSRNALIPEISVQFIDTFITTNKEPFQKEFRSNPEIEINTEGYVMCPERLCSCSSRYLLHHGCFDLNKTICLEEIPDGFDNYTSFSECLPHIGVYNQINISLPVSCLNVLQTMPLLRKWPQGFCEEDKVLHLDSKLVCPCSE